MTSPRRALGLVLFSLFTIAVVVAVRSQESASVVGEEQCPKNEVYYKCGPNCQSECATLNQPCTIQYIQCPSGCYCMDGYARLESGKCVPVEQCASGGASQPEAIS